MRTLYYIITPSLSVHLIVISVLGLIVQTLYYLVLTENAKEKKFEGLIGAHILIASLLFRKINTSMVEASNLHDLYQVARYLVCMILVFYFFYCRDKETRYKNLLGLGLVIVTLPLMEGLFKKSFGLVLIISLWILIIRASILYIGALKRRKTYITDYSIKEAFDSLYNGVVFAEKNGGILLINKQMISLIKSLMGDNCRNMNRFWEEIEALGGIVSSRRSETYIYKSNFSSWKLMRKEIDYQGRKIWQITATDITEQENINEKLKDYRQRLMNQQEDLKNALKNLDSLGRKEAINRSWDYIHGVLGQKISFLQRIVKEDSEYGIDELKGLVGDLQTDLTTIREEKPEEIYEGVVSSFDSLGVKFHREGDFPPNEDIANTFIEIIREGSNNALRHGNAENIYLSMETDTKYSLTMKNDGDLSLEQITWGGGLKSIHAKVKDFGGSLRIQTRPEFNIRVEIPNWEGGQV